MFFYLNIPFKLIVSDALRIAINMSVFLEHFRTEYNKNNILIFEKGSGLLMLRFY